MNSSWPHQTFAYNEFRRLALDGVRRLLVTSPTGGGKTRMIEDCAAEVIRSGSGVVLFCNRKLLVDQVVRGLIDRGIEHGVRAAGHDTNPWAWFQVSSIQTEHSRVVRRKTWKPVENCGLFIIDEAHLQENPTARKVFAEYEKLGAVKLGFTATPLGLSGCYDQLVVAGTPSELRECGALVPAVHHGCTEPDMRNIRKYALGEDLSEEDNAKVVMVPGIHGVVIDWFRRLNPHGLASIGFAPGVPESVGFAEAFESAGIPAAHIDGDRVWVRGVERNSTEESRRDVLEMSRTGEIRVVWNRFVLREAVDMPWLRHGILATVFGSLQSFLQSGGRLLRSCPPVDKQSVTVQDHGGCLDSATEVLTSRGWVGHHEVRDDDTVAAYDRFSGSIRWCPILHRHERFLEPGEKMYQAKGRCLDVRVTGNHRILTTERDSVDGQKVWRDAYEFTRADDLSASAKRVQIPVAGVQKMPGVRLADDQLRFLGWWVTDGTRSGKRQQVSITQADHQPHINDLRACLVACGFHFREVKRQPKSFESRPQTEFQIPKGTCKSRPRNGWWGLRHYMEKDLALPLELMDERQFGVFLHAVHLGDGDKAKADGSYRISTGNKTFADRMQSMAVRRGWKCNIASAAGSARLNPIYTLNMQKATAQTVHGAEAKTADRQLKLVESPSIPSVTLVWCVANELETLITRRNGMVAIVGNSWWRHGSLNDDRTWRLSDTNRIAAGLRYDDIAGGGCGPKKPEPFLCPKCQTVLVIRDSAAGSEARCWKCGHCFVFTRRSRPVIQADGELVLHEGSLFRPRSVERRADTATKWEKVYWRSRKSGKTFTQARGLFYHENGYYPPPDLPLMPRTAYDWYLPISKVRDVYEKPR